MYCTDLYTLKEHLKPCFGHYREDDLVLQYFFHCFIISNHYVLLYEGYILLLFICAKLDSLDGANFIIILGGEN